MHQQKEPFHNIFETVQDWTVEINVYQWQVLNPEL